MKTTITFLGFGEAAQSIAKGLQGEGGVSIRAYDIRFKDEQAAPVLVDKARDIGAATFDSIDKAIDGADLVFSTVVGAVAVTVARDAAPWMKAGQIYLDLNSVSPKTKREAEAVITPTGAGFVESAVMARVPPYGHKVPMLLAGQPAPELAPRLAALGMEVESVGERVGQASVVKMLRSIMIKGVEGLLIECLVAASRYDIEERVIDSVTETFPGLDWRETATYYLGRTAIHGARRVTEMKEVVETLRELDVEPVMAEAIGRRIKWGFETLQGYAWDGADGKPRDYREILNAFKSLTPKVG